VDSLQGRLLVASPSLFDPNFRRAVVLIVEHTDDGAAGLILNRPSETRVADAVPELDSRAADDAEVMYVGGPVEPGAVVVLAELDEPDEAAMRVLGDIGFISVEEEPDSVRRRRVFAGYAGWGGGQLEDELAREDWLVEEAEPDDVFSDGDLWGDVLRRKGGVFELIARMPDDPSLN
jgi:putative transcriptional regulator